MGGVEALRLFFLDCLVGHGRGLPRSVVELAGFVDQHDRNAVADRIGTAVLPADPLLRLRIVFQGPLGQRADQDTQQLAAVDVVINELLPPSALCTVNGAWFCSSRRT